MAASSSLRRSLFPKLNSSFIQLSSFSTTTNTTTSSSSSSSTTKKPASFSSFRAAQSTIVSESNPNKIADILLSQSSFSAFTRYRPIYPYAIRKLARANRPDLIERVVDDHLSKEKLSEGFVIRFIMLYSEAKMIDHSVRLFNDFMLRFPGSEKMLCAILTALLKNSKFDLFHEVFDSASKEEVSVSVVPGVKAWNLKLRAFCEEGKVELAEELFAEMMEKGSNVRCDVHSYNVMLGAYLKAKNWVKFDEMVSEVLSGGFEGNVTTYKHRIVRLCKGKDSFRAIELLDEMVAKGVKPNAGCYDWIVYGFCKGGELESAKLVLERMISDGVVAPSSLTCFTLFKHMVQGGEFVLALHMCKMILKRRWVPPFEAMEGLVKGLVGMSERKEAIKVIKMMKKRLKGPALDSWGKIEVSLAL